MQLCFNDIVVTRHTTITYIAIAVILSTLFHFLSTLFHHAFDYTF